MSVSTIRTTASRWPIVPIRWEALFVLVRQARDTQMGMEMVPVIVMQYVAMGFRCHKKIATMAIQLPQMDALIKMA